jgi:signal transduction histidine kinase
VAIYLLQDAIPTIDRINADAVTLIDGVHDLSDRIPMIEDARERAGRPPADEGPLRDRLDLSVAALAAHPAMAGSAAPAEAFRRVTGLLPPFIAAAGVPAEEAARARGELRAALRELTRTLRAFVAAEQAGFARYFRALVLGLTIAALVMVNVAVFVLLRTAQVVLRPVAQLVEGSRELAAERFDHRVEVDQGDEFGELATAYNRMAEQLKASEERKAEALRQLAVTLNHDLNNSLAVIEMQLSLLDRQAGSASNLARYFREIQATLGRMSRTVASLKHIRRVVLTDYVDGQKMVDLERSVAQPAAPESPTPTPTTPTTAPTPTHPAPPRSLP